MRAAEPRPILDLDETTAAEFLTGHGGALTTTRGTRVEHRKAKPSPGWYLIDPKRGALGPFHDPSEARRALRPW